MLEIVTYLMVMCLVLAAVMAAALVAAVVAACVTERVIAFVYRKVDEVRRARGRR